MSRRAAIGWTALGAGLSAAVLLALAPLRNAAAPADSEDTPAGHSTPDTASSRDGEVRLDRKEQQRIGLAVVAVTTATAPTVTQGFARGLDGSALAAIDSEIVTARAAGAVSHAEAARLTALAAQDQSASTKSVEAARAQYAADTARLSLAERRIGLEYGPGLARLGNDARHVLIADIAAGRAALVRIDVPGANVIPGARVRIDGDGALSILGPAASADPKLQSAGLLAVLRGLLATSASNGRVFGVAVERGGAQTGVAVPRDAVLRWRGGLWVYRQTGPETFERIELVNARPTGNMWFVPSGIRKGDRLALNGSGTLLAIDRSAGSTAAGDGD